MSEAGLAHTPTSGPWLAYFTVHGDPHIVTDSERPFSTIVATIATSPEDYGRANCLLMAAAPDMAAALWALDGDCCYEIEERRCCSISRPQPESEWCGRCIAHHVINGGHFGGPNP